MKDSLNGRKKQLTISILLGIAALLCLFVILNVFVKDKLQLQDYEQISQAQYDTVFLSMYSIDTYQEEDYSYYRGMTLFKAAYCIPSLPVCRLLALPLPERLRKDIDCFLQFSHCRTGHSGSKLLLFRNPGMADCQSRTLPR